MIDRIPIGGLLLSFHIIKGHVWLTIEKKQVDEAGENKIVYSGPVGAAGCG